MVQFEKYNDFVNAMKAFCGRSMEKEGTRLKADYELTWDKIGFFRNSRKPLDNRDGGYRNESFGCNQDDLRRKRFRLTKEPFTCATLSPQWPPRQWLSPLLL